MNISIHAPHTGRDGVVLLSGRRCSKFQSTRPIRGATLCLFRRLTLFRDFNPRAPYGARRTKILLTTLQTLFQSTRPIRGATIFQNSHSGSTTLFQSTRPIRGATGTIQQPVCPYFYFNPRAPYGARRYSDKQSRRARNISIHAPHTGRDSHTLLFLPFQVKFQSTRPIRGATLCRLAPNHHVDISIHAPHTGRDFSMFGTGDMEILVFQSTRPIRGATA